MLALIHYNIKEDLNGTDTEKSLIRKICAILVNLFSARCIT